MNPLGMVEALMGSMNHASSLDKLNYGQEMKQDMSNYIKTLRRALHNTFRYGQGTRDMAGPAGLTTEAFIAKVANRLERYMAEQEVAVDVAQLKETPKVKVFNVDREALEKMFREFDTDNNGAISIDELEIMLTKLGVAPVLDPKKKGTTKDSVIKVNPC